MPGKTTLSPSQMQRLAAVFHASPDGPGIVAGVQFADAEPARWSAGLANLEHGVPMHAATRLRIGSVSKHFACALALVFEREGRLSLEDPVARHLPSAAGGWGERTTLRQLCDNTGGVPDFLELLHLTGAGLLGPVTSAEAAEMILSRPVPNAEAGTRMIYSAGGFLILSLALEHAAGSDMASLLRQRLFGPAGMADTALVPDDQLMVPRLATPYVPGPGGVLRRGGWGLELNCEGGIVSTLDDMLSWGRWLLSDQEGRALFERMRRPATYAGGSSGRYGLGLTLDPIWSEQVVCHGGRTPGFRSEFALLPDLDGVAVLITNDGRRDPATDLTAVLSEILGDPPSAAADWGALAGTYSAPECGLCIEIEVEDGDPVLVSSSARHSLTPAGPNAFRVVTIASDLVLHLDGDNLDLSDSGRKVRLRRYVDGRATVPPDIAGRYVNTDQGAEYVIAKAGSDWTLRMQGRRGFTQYLLRAVERDFLVADPVGRFPSFHHPRIRLRRDAQGAPARLEVFTDRTAGLDFARVRPEGTAELPEELAAQ